MQTLVASAISIDDVRDMFGADPALAERLREIAARRFAETPPPKRRWFGPVIKQDPAFRVDAALPSSADLEAVLSGGYVSPDRMPQAWRLVIAWLEELSAASERIAWDPAQMDTIEFDLARAGLNSDYSLRHLAERDLGISIRALPGHFAGYAKHVQAAETFEALKSIRTAPELGDGARALLDPLLRVLGVAASDPGLDVVVLTTDA